MPAIATAIGLGTFATGLYSSYMNNRYQAQANAENWRRQQEMNRQNYLAQKEFYQNSIQWRKQDAIQAGINPIYALGASGASFSPSFQAAYDTALKDGTADSLNNAINAGISTYRATQEAKMQKAQISAINTGEMKDTAIASYYLKQAEKIAKEINKTTGATATGGETTKTESLTKTYKDDKTKIVEPNFKFDSSQEELTGQARMIFSESPANASKEAVKLLKQGKFSLIYKDPANYHRATIKVYDNFEQWAEKEGIDIYKNLNYKSYSNEQKKDYQIRLYIDYLMDKRYSWWQSDLKREFKREVYKDITGKDYKSY